MVAISPAFSQVKTLWGQSLNCQFTNILRRQGHIRQNHSQSATVSVFLRLKWSYEFSVTKGDSSRFPTLTPILPYKRFWVLTGVLQFPFVFPTENCPFALWACLVSEQWNWHKKTHKKRSLHFGNSRMWYRDCQRKSIVPISSVPTGCQDTQMQMLLRDYAPLQ